MPKPTIPIPMVSVTNELLTPEEAIVELQRTWLQQQHVAGLAYELGIANVELCGDDTSYEWGIEWLTLADFPNANIRIAGSQLGVGRIPFVTITTPQSPAVRAGIQNGDMLLTVNGEAIPTAPEKYLAYIEVLGVRVPMYRYKIDGMLKDAANDGQKVSVTVLRDRDELALELEPLKSCDYGVIVLEDSNLRLENIGTNILISNALLDLTHSDEEVQMMIAHQMAHILSKHGSKKKRNALIGGVTGGAAVTALLLPVAVVGAIAGEDVSGVGEVIAVSADASSRVGGAMFALRHEKEADYLASYLLERAGIDADQVTKVWQRMPSDTFLTKSHPKIERRVKNIEATVDEIGNKRAAGLRLLPSEELKPVSVDD